MKSVKKHLNSQYFNNSNIAKIISKYKLFEQIRGPILGRVFSLVMDNINHQYLLDTDMVNKNMLIEGTIRRDQL